MPLVEEEIRNRTRDRTPEVRQQQNVAYWVGSSSIAEAFFGVLALALGAIALTGANPFTLTALGIVSLGLGLVLIGSTAGAKYTKPLAEMQDSTMGGLTAELIGGLIAILFGVLGLAGVAPFPLFQVAILIIGVSLLVGSIATARMNYWIVNRRSSIEEQSRVMNQRLVLTSAGVQALVGITAIVLAIIALAGQFSLEIAMVSVLVLGGGLLLTGLALGVRVLSLFSRRRETT